MIVACLITKLHKASSKTGNEIAVTPLGDLEPHWGDPKEAESPSSALEPLEPLEPSP